MKKIILILSTITAGVCFFNSCSYEEQPPKTTDSSSNYVLPKGEIPSQAEIDEVNALRAEYNEAVGNI